MSELAASADNGLLFTEPDFTEVSGRLSQELANDWMPILLKENQQRIENLTDTFNLFVHPKAVQYLFTICLRLRLPRDVKYLALNIFNEFVHN